MAPAAADVLIISKLVLENTEPLTLKKYLTMIERTSLDKLRHFDFFQVLSLVRDYVNAEDKDALKLTAAAAALEAALKQMDSALKQSNSVAATKEILKADEVRDKTVQALYSALKTFAHSPEASEAQAAEILLQEALKYGRNLAKLPLREESAAISNLLQDFAKPENVARITALRLDAWLAILRQQNRAFDAHYKSRSGEQAEVEVGAVRTARVALQDAFDHLAKTINANAFLSGEAPYRNLSDKINVEIARALAEAKARSKKTENKTQPPTA